MSSSNGKCVSSMRNCGFMSSGTVLIPRHRKARITNAVNTAGGGRANVDDVTKKGKAPNDKIGLVDYRVLGDLASAKKRITSSPFVTTTVGCNTSGKTIVDRGD